jgi:hypothetical protein
MKPKNYYFTIMFVTFLCLCLVSCGVSMIKGQKWLDSKTDKPEINISGTWISHEWGAATFKQEDNKITGMLGDYPVKGVVSGNSIYLLMYSQDSIHYSADLKLSDKETFNGFYSKYGIIDEVIHDQGYITRPMSLKRMSTFP